MTLGLVGYGALEPDWRELDRLRPNKIYPTWTCHHAKPAPSMPQYRHPLTQSQAQWGKATLVHKVVP